MIMIMGPRGAGKTTLIKKLAGEGGFDVAGTNEFDGVCPAVKHTTGISLGGYTSSHGKRIALREIGSSVYPLWSNFLDDPVSEKIIFMVDGTNRLQVATACCQFYSVLSSEKVGSRKVALVVSKSDGPGFMSNVEIRDALHLDAVIAAAEEQQAAAAAGEPSTSCCLPAMFKISALNDGGLTELRQWMSSP